MVRALFILSLLILFTGCNSNKRDEAIKAKEVRLQHWEEQLVLREQMLAQKEEEFTRKTAHADSLSRDSIMIYEPRIIGKWSVKMTCTETTCPGSAVGDIKSESWEFSYEGNRLVVSAIVKDKVSRIYYGQNTISGIKLREEMANAGLDPAVRITVKLSLTANDIMEGQREIVRENDCRILYTLQLNKQ